eukprot:13743947-Alexandrium_andersonii.AAC.1
MVPVAVVRDSGALHVQRARGARAVGISCKCKRPSCTCAGPEPRTPPSELRKSSNLQHCFRRLKLRLRGPRTGLKLDPRSC